jgi:hypothetical protein
MGPSDAVRNPERLRFFSSFGIEPSRIRSVKQIHSRRVIPAEEIPVLPAEEAGGSPRGDPGSEAGFSEADGLVTGDRTLVLAVTVADCVPVFLWDRHGRGFGIVHSGWKGTGIVLEAVKLLGERYRIPPGDLNGFIGPAIGPCCYEVDPDRARLFRNEWGPAAAVERAGRFFLDLPGTNRRILERAGVGEIDSVERCTCCSPELGSYRRQGSGAFSRMIAFIGYLV